MVHLGLMSHASFGTWSSPGGGSLPGDFARRSSRHSQCFWVCQVLQVSSPTIRVNSSPGGYWLTAPPLSSPGCLGHVVANLVTWPSWASNCGQILPGAKCTPSCLNMLFIIDNLWQAQMYNNKTSIRFRSMGSLFPLTLFQVWLSLGMWALKSPRNMTELLKRALRSSLSKNSKTGGCCWAAVWTIVSESGLPVLAHKRVPPQECAVY